jgi:transcriptional regulator with XRE-family HTH domain
MGKDRTYPVKVDVIRQLMEDKNISVSALAMAVGMDRKSIHNILDKKSQPLERSLVAIATMLGVKWRTLVEGYDGKLQDLEGSGGLAAKTTFAFLVDIRNEGMTEEMANELIMRKIKGRIKNLDEIRISIMRDDDEN